MAKILFLAPHPFYLERGTPIAVDLALQALEGEGYDIDLVTYPEGEARSYRRVCQYWVPRVPGVKNVPPGFTWKKLVYSVLMIFPALRLACTRRYTIVHAVEEACFIALLLKMVRGLPYVYDMDSSIARQLVEKKPVLRCFFRLFNWMEGLAVRHAEAVVAVCPALAALAREHGGEKILLLQDISLLDRYRPGGGVTDLRREMGSEAPLVLYVGNLEYYQGIDLLLEGLALAKQQGIEAILAVIGGRDKDVRHYRSRAAELGIGESTRFFGPRPVADLGAYLAQADILASPRISGNNTPMKVYTYLDAGKPLLATRIGSHTQALDDATSCLVEPTPKGIARGIARLAGSAELRRLLGEAGKRQAAERHSWGVFRQSLTDFYKAVLVGLS